MGTVAVEGGGGGRRSLDSEINMIPMIDLLMVTISFLLITAVWSHMARLDATARVPGPETAPTPDAPEVALHVRQLEEGKFRLEWRAGSAAPESSTDVTAPAQVVMVGASRVVRYPALARAIQDEFAQHGRHRLASDSARDRAIVHTPHELPYASMVAWLDAVHEAKLPGEATPGRRSAEPISAFHAVLAVD
jgi:biopolymer transport protein ExbD